MKLIINKNDQTLLTELLDKKVMQLSNTFKIVNDNYLSPSMPKKLKVDLPGRLKELKDAIRKYNKLYGKINNA